MYLFNNALCSLEINNNVPITKDDAIIFKRSVINKLSIRIIESNNKLTAIQILISIGKINTFINLKYGKPNENLINKNNAWKKLIVKATTNPVPTSIKVPPIKTPYPIPVTIRTAPIKPA